MILWGPPGTGKTTIAGIIANSLQVPFYTLSAISAGVKEVREVIAEAREKERAILFIDEIHRFNKGQQDALLGAVEKGIVTLIGATTENPSFEVNSALLSRCQVYVLKPLTEADLIKVLHNALRDDAWLRESGIELKETAARSSHRRSRSSSPVRRRRHGRSRWPPRWRSWWAYRSTCRRARSRR